MLKKQWQGLSSPGRIKRICNNRQMPHGGLNTEVRVPSLAQVSLSPFTNSDIVSRPLKVNLGDISTLL